jgi:two-component system, OmpR family, alkaline phosphatase synthesis response regulator PhoP
MQTDIAHILIVDDEPDILEFIHYNLLKEGYTVSMASSGLEALAKAKEKLPDLILLDIMMPEMDGIEVCSELRANPRYTNTVIAFLTARNEDFTQIAGFDVGADDYINKPIKPRLLLSRIKALLRRKVEAASDNNIRQVGDLGIDQEKYLIYSNGETINLARKEFELINLLASKPGKVFSRQEIFNKVWGYDVIVGDRTIDVHIRKLREKIGMDSIKTVKGIGYKLDL